MKSHLVLRAVTTVKYAQQTVSSPTVRDQFYASCPCSNLLFSDTDVAKKAASRSRRKNKAVVINPAPSANQSIRLLFPTDAQPGQLGMQGVSIGSQPHYVPLPQQGLEAHGEQPLLRQSNASDYFSLSPALPHVSNDHLDFDFDELLEMQDDPDADQDSDPNDVHRLTNSYQEEALARLDVAPVTTQAGVLIFQKLFSLVPLQINSRIVSLPSPSPLVQRNMNQAPLTPAGNSRHLVRRTHLAPPTRSLERENVVPCVGSTLMERTQTYAITLL